MEDFLRPYAYQIWNNDSKVAVREIGQEYAPFTYSPELNESIDLQEMEPLFDYYLVYLRTNTVLDDLSLDTEAMKILEFIYILKYYGFSPEEICIWYFPPNSMPDRAEQEGILFGNWIEITDVNDVIKVITAEQWFNEEKVDW